MSLKDQLLSDNVIRQENLSKTQSNKEVCGEPTPHFPAINLKIKKKPLGTSQPLGPEVNPTFNKKLTFYDSENFDGVSEDLVRKAASALWETKDNKVSFKPNQNISFERSATYQFNSYFQRILYSGLDRDLLDVNNLVTGSFYDLHFDLPVPVKPSNTTNKYPLKQNWEVEPHYNFFVEDYENSLKDVPEAALPNASIIYSEIQGSADSKNQLPVYNQRFWLHTTLSRRLKTAKSFSYRGFKTNEVNVKNTTLKYFDDYGSQVNSILKSHKEDIKENVLDVSKNIFVTGKDYNETYLDSIDTQHQYPMSSEVSFPTFNNFGRFGRVLQESSTDSYLMSLVKRANSETLVLNPKKLNKSTGRFKSITRDFQVVESTILDTFSLNPEDKPLKSNKKNLRIFNVDSWLEDLLQENFDGNQEFSMRVFGDRVSTKDSLFLGKLEESLRDITKDDFKNLRSLSNLFFTKGYLDLIRTKQRTPEQIFGGQKSHSETAFYMVKKSDEFGNVISHYYLNPHGQEALRFVDTQVKFNKSYRVEVFQYVFVVGSKYNYTNKLGNTETDSIYISSSPMPVLVEIPLFKTEYKIVDSYPMPPEVSINFYKDSPRKILVSLKPGLGKNSKDPIFIEEDDFPNSDAIQFEKDDRPKEYISYMTKNKPDSYSDFSKLQRRFPVELSDSKSFVLDVEPNRDYWLTFRSKDVHDKLSNPTEVWQIRIVSENGLVFPQTKIYNLEEKTKTVQSFSKRLRIEPSELQLQINNGKLSKKLSTDIKMKDLELENTSEKIWDVDDKDRKFKLRVTSKETGKVLDFNFKMTLQRKLGE